MQAADASAPKPIFADPTPLGLIGLSIGCAALLPIAFGQKEALTADGLRLAAFFCLFFGAGCQMLAGLMSFANKNGLGGTLFTAFSFNWVMNYWSLTELAAGRVPNTAIIFAVDVCFLIVFLVMTVAFGYFSKLLLLFLLDIDILYMCRIARELTHAAALSHVIAMATVGLMVIALYIAFALVLNLASGKAMLPIGGPAFLPAAAAAPAPAPAKA